MAIKFSIQGLKNAWKFESGFRQYSCISIVLFVSSFFIANSFTHWCVLFASLILILVVELINSAIEAVADASFQDFNELIGRAKDMGSAAVFLCVILTAIIWGVSIYLYAETYFTWNN